MAFAKFIEWNCSTSPNTWNETLSFPQLNRKRKNFAQIWYSLSIYVHMLNIQNLTVLIHLLHKRKVRVSPNVWNFFKVEYLCECESIFETNLRDELGDQVGFYGEKPEIKNLLQVYSNFFKKSGHDVNVNESKRNWVYSICTLLGLQFGHTKNEDITFCSELCLLYAYTVFWNCT
jgi:hypothetical protein